MRGFATGVGSKADIGAITLGPGKYSRQRQDRLCGKILLDWTVAR